MWRDQDQSSYLNQVSARQALIKYLDGQFTCECQLHVGHELLAMHNQST